MSRAEKLEATVTRTAGPDACHPTTIKPDGSNGYPLRTVAGVKMTAAKAQYIHKHGPDSIPEGKCLLHTCGNKGCMNGAHHKIGTQAENMQDSVKAGTHAKRKLDRYTARAIWTLHYVLGQRQRELAEQFHTTPENVRHVLARRSWKKATADLVHLKQKPKKARRHHPATQPEARI